ITSSPLTLRFVFLDQSVADADSSSIVPHKATDDPVDTNPAADRRKQSWHAPVIAKTAVPSKEGLSLWASFGHLKRRSELQ
ncbi:hypothetical protein AMECASPLE_019055, partial [Ameca splendens]